MKKNIVFYLTLAVSIALFVGGFFVPPIGIIDGSVLKAGGILLGFAVLSMLPDLLNSSNHIKITKGDASLEVSQDE